MTDAVFDRLGAVLTRWTMGASALAEAPWQAAPGTDPGEAELRLLALSGQFLGVAVTAEPPAGLRTLPDIPALALPTVPEGLRPLTARILGSMRDTQTRAELLQFLAGRGWTVHPGDWLPAAGDEDAPDLYAPWRDWVAAAADTARRTSDALTAQTWDDYGPAERRVALAGLRRGDPGAARAVLEAKLAGEGADARLRLLSVLADGLSEADIPFLEGLAAGDRAPKVKALAASLLARLGRGPAVGADIAELAGFFAVEMKGLIRRSRIIRIHPIKTPAQRQRREALFADADVTALAGALGLAPQELVAAWTWDADGQADAMLVALIARTGTDALVAQTAGAVSGGDGARLQRLAWLAPRLPPDQRAALAARILSLRDSSFLLAKIIAGGAARVDDPMATPAGAALLAALAQENARPADQLPELQALGLIASRTGASRALERLAAAGLLRSDPSLDMLRLNAALEKGTNG